MHWRNTKEEETMPRTRGKSIFFTAITAWMMVYCMTLYNTVLATGNFTNQTFLIALRGMWIEYVIIFAIQTFTVVWQVAFASIIGLYHGYGFTANVIPDYIMTYCRNFVMALPLQLLIVGPLARLIFRSIFIREKCKIARKFCLTFFNMRNIIGIKRVAD